MHRLSRCALLVLLSACSRASPAHAPPPGAPAAQGNTPPPPTARAQAPSQLERIRPPARRCVAGGEPVEVLLGEGARALDAGDAARALACADEALRTAPRQVAALQLRAGALAALSRVDEARSAWARALAVDPDDPETLRGAAELFVTRLGEQRDAIETGLEYARRGARIALRSARKDRELAGRLRLVAGMALNDLGRSREALRELDEAVRLRPGDVDAAYERGVSLYELCRFDEARRAFERVLAAAPDDAWAVHHLGLVLERLGQHERAGDLLGRAAQLAPGELRQPLPIDRSAFEAEVRRAMATLPEHEQRALEGVPVQVEELPHVDDLLAVEPPLSPSILGLYRGPPEQEPCLETEPSCRSIVFYWKNLVRFARSEHELREQVRVTLLHELGHLHGETDDELRERGLE